MIGRSWHSRSIDVLPKGKEPLDIVYDIIKKTYTEERNWDPSKKELIEWLKEQVPSEVSNLVQSHDHLKRENIGWYEAEDGSLSDLEARMAASNPQEASEDIVEKRILVETIEDAVFEAIDGDPELEKLFEIMLEGYWKETRLIAQKMECSRYHVNNLKRRLFRKIDVVRKELARKEQDARKETD